MEFSWYRETPKSSISDWDFPLFEQPMLLHGFFPMRRHVEPQLMRPLGELPQLRFAAQALVQQREVQPGRGTFRGEDGSFPMDVPQKWMV